MPANCVEEHDPLKQGLKQGYAARIGECDIVEEHDPLKQGLKLFCIRIPSLLVLVEEHDPLKQGLKHHAKDLSRELRHESKSMIH